MTGPEKSQDQNRDRFGKGYIRPTRSEAERVDAKFYELIAYLHHKRKLTWQKVGEELGIDATNAARRVTGKTLDKDERKLILDYIYDEADFFTDPAGSGLADIRDCLYFAALAFYHIQQTSQDNARAHLTGTYRLWRHSVEAEGEFVHGRLDVYESHDSGAVCVAMIQPLKARGLMRALTEEFYGYMFRIADMYVMLLRDVANNDLRITIFPTFRVEHIGKDKNPNSVFPGTQSHIVHMDGFGMGIDGNKLFISPVYVELVDDKDELARMDAMLDVVSEADAPERIVKKLRRMPIIVSGFGSF